LCREVDVVRVDFVGSGWPDLVEELHPVAVRVTLPVLVFFSASPTSMCPVAPWLPISESASIEATHAGVEAAGGGRRRRCRGRRPAGVDVVADELPARDG